MTPQQWAYLTPPQQYQHATLYGPPPAWYPPSIYVPHPQAPVSVAVAQSVVVQRDRHIAHGFHLLMTLLTGGLWGFVWLAIVICRR